MTKEQGAENLPIITKMPIINPEVWETLYSQTGQGKNFYWLLGSDLVKANPQHRQAYEETLREGKSPETPDATSAVVLLVLRALDIQAKNDGHRLPEIPNPIDPLPALREFIPHAKGSESELIDIAYNEILKTNPVIGEIVQDIAKGAPDELLKIATERQGKRAVMYAYYGVKSVIPKSV
jgi:hypothetical protein